MVESHELKALNTKLKEIDLAIFGAQGQVREASLAIGNLRNQKKKLLEQIESLKTNNRKLPAVSEHAILRYLERVEGLDLEGIKAKILSETFIELWGKIAGNGKFPIQDGIRCVVKNGTITTIED